MCVHTGFQADMGCKGSSVNTGKGEGKEVLHRTFLCYKSDGKLEGHLLNPRIKHVTHRNKLYFFSEMNTSEVTECSKWRGRIRNSVFFPRSGMLAEL